MEIDAPTLSAADAQACRDFVADLPATLGGEDQVETTGDTAYGAAWGDPAIVLTCGVGVPDEFNQGSACLLVSKVGWFVPPEQEADQDADVLLTAVGYSPRISLLVPADDRGSTSAAALADLAGPVKRGLDLTNDCL